MSNNGYIIAHEVTIYGAGTTLDAAIADAVEWLEGYDSAEELTADLHQGQPRTTGGNSPVYSMEATPELIAQVNEHGAPDDWGDIDGVACTAEQEDEADE